MRSDRITVTIEIDLADRPSSADLLVGEITREVKRVARSRDFALALTMATADAVLNNHVGEEHVGDIAGPQAHRAARITSQLTTRFS